MGLLRVYVLDPRKLPLLLIYIYIYTYIYSNKIKIAKAHLQPYIYIYIYINCDCAGAEILIVSPPSMSPLQSSGGQLRSGAACYIDLVAPTRAFQLPKSVADIKTKVYYAKTSPRGFLFLANVFKLNLLGLISVEVRINFGVNGTSF